MKLIIIVKSFKGTLLKLKKIWIHFLMIFEGWKTAKKMLNEHPGTILISADIGIGDRVFMLAFLKKWVEMYDVKDWAILTINSKDSLYQCFDIDESKLIDISYKKNKQLNIFYYSEFGDRFRQKYREAFHVNASVYFRGTRLLINPSAFLFSSLTKAVYRIPQDTTPAICVKTEPKDSLKKLYDHGIINLKKIILINPYANSCNQTPISFFQNIADKLIAKDFSIICSVVGAQKPLEGTLGITFPLDEALSLCEACGAVVGARSGFMDLIAFSDANIICVDNHDYEFSDLFRLEANWPMNPSIRTFYYDANNEDSVVSKIVEYIFKIVRWENIENEAIH